MNNRTKKMLLHSCGFFLILFIVIQLSGSLFKSFQRSDHSEKINWVLNKKNQIYDFAVMGNSRGYVNVDVNFLEKLSNSNGINLSLDGTAIEEQFMLFEKFLEFNEIKQLYLQVDLRTLDPSSFVAIHQYLYIPYFNSKLIFQAITEQFGSIAYIWKLFPAFLYSRYNSEVGLKSILKYYWKPKEYDESGSHIIEKSFSSQQLRELENSSIRMIEIDDSKKGVLIRLINLCKQRNIKVIFFIAPYYKFDKFVNNKNDILSIYEGLSQKYQIEFHSFLGSEICQDESNFFDSHHLNKTGAEKFTQLLYNELFKKNKIAYKN